MADQYQGFTNPTIIPEQKYGWQSANQNVSGIGNALSKQFAMQQELENSKKLLMYKALSEQYAQQLNPLNRILQGGKVAEAMSNAGLPVPPEVQQYMFGSHQSFNNMPNSNFQAPSGSNIPTQGLMPSGVPLSPMNPIGNGMVMESVNYGPFGPKGEQKATNIPGLMDVEKAKLSVQPETPDAASAITYANLMKKSINNIQNIVQKPDFDWGLAGAAVASLGDPSLVTMGGINTKSKDLLNITNELNLIKRSAFGEGGKNLTDTEKNIIFRTINPIGQTKEEWLRLLDESNKILESKSLLLSKKPSDLGFASQGSINNNPVMNQQTQEGKQLDHSTALQLLQQAGGDKNKARQLASQMGYKF